MTEPQPLTARDLVAEHGEDARRYAHEMVQAAILKGDKEQESHWLQVYLDVDGLLAHRQFADRALGL